ncbi:MAG TPA: hypothetical protein DCX79_13880 [Planctomycetaceae bacterium]|nr:hypothetical protein [Planctomycetaceae bacterium]
MDSPPRPQCGFGAEVDHLVASAGIDIELQVVGGGAEVDAVVGGVSFGGIAFGEKAVEGGIGIRVEAGEECGDGDSVGSGEIFAGGDDELLSFGGIEQQGASGGVFDEGGGDTGGVFGECGNVLDFAGCGEVSEWCGVIIEIEFQDGAVAEVLSGG